MIETSLSEEGHNAMEEGDQKWNGRVQRRTETSRKRLLPLLLAGALMVPLGSVVTSEAADEPKEVQKAEDPKLTALRSEVTRLVADLDSDKYRIREQAQKRLQQIALEWVMTKKEPFPLISLLQPTKDTPIEPRRRLERILSAHEYEELQLLWRPIIFQEPPEWKGRKEAPRVHEVLKALEKHTDQRISLGPKDFADGAVKGGLSGRTFWEVLERVRQPAGGKFGIYRSSDGSLSVYAEDHGTYAMNGGVLGRAYQRYEDYPPVPKREISVTFLTDAIVLGNACVTKATGITDKGRKLLLEGPPIVDALGKVWPRTPELETRLVMPFEEGEQTIDLRVTVLLHGFETRRERVKDLTKVTAFPVQSYELKILGVSKPVPESKCWSINALLGGKENNEHEWLLLLNAMQCRAFDAKGEPISVAGLSGGAYKWRWQFHAEPHSIELVLPGRETTSEKTLVFKGIPLN